MILISGLFLIITILLEYNSAHLLFSNLVLLSLVIHLGASCCIIITARCLLINSFKSINWQVYLFIFLLSTFVPIFGMVIGLFVIIAILRLHTKSYKYAEVLDGSINLKTLKPIHTKYGAGGAIINLMQTNAPTTNRVQALFVLGQNQFSYINKFMFALLSDNADEIRLLAFNILEQQESYITQDINRFHLLLDKEEPNSKNHAKLEKSLALLYWEFIYRSLISHGLEESILSKALTYTLSALKILKEDLTLWALLGKIYIRLGEIKKAEAAFSHISSLEIPPYQILPYLAEIKYKLHDYQAVREYLKSNIFLNIPLIAPVKRFWDLP